MKLFFMCLSLGVANFAIAMSEESISTDCLGKEILHLTHYPTAIPKDRAVYFQNPSLERETAVSEITVLKVETTPLGQPHLLVRDILNADADIVLANHLSLDEVSDFYEAFEPLYSHFIHIPNENGNLFITSKYPFIKPVTTWIQQDDSLQEILQFTLQETYQMRVSLQDLSTHILPRSHTRSGVPITLTMMQSSSPSRKSYVFPCNSCSLDNALEFSPVRHTAGENDNKAGFSTEVEVNRSWGGKEGGSWGMSGKAEAHDDRGNYVEGEIKQNDKGEGSLSARVGHEEK